MKGSSLNQMSRLFLKLILILSLILILDRGIGMILKHFYFRQVFGRESKVTYVIDSTVADIIILGSSRANHHYVPEVFESRFHQSCYNAGSEGNYILYSYAIFKAIVQRYSPKMLIFDVRPYELGNIKSEYERLSLLLPYYQKHPEIKQVIDLQGPLEKFKQFSAIYSFNSMIFQIVGGNLELNKFRKQDLKGYIPLFGKMKQEKIETWDLSDIKIDENKVNFLKDIISTCKERGIKLVFVYSPMWIINPESSCNNIISDLCSESGVDYIDMSNDSTFMNRTDYFEDSSHLNNTGAMVFSNMLIDMIQHDH